MQPIRELRPNSADSFPVQLNVLSASHCNTRERERHSARLSPLHLRLRSDLARSKLHCWNDQLERHQYGQPSLAFTCMGKSFEKKGKALLFSVIAVCVVILITVFAIFGAAFVYHRATTTTYHGSNPFEYYTFTAFWTKSGSGRINVIGPTSSIASTDGNASIDLVYYFQTAAFPINYYGAQANLFQCPSQNGTVGCEGVQATVTKYNTTTLVIQSHAVQLSHSPQWFDLNIYNYADGLNASAVASINVAVSE